MNVLALRVQDIDVKQTLTFCENKVYKPVFFFKILSLDIIMLSGKEVEAMYSKRHHQNSLTLQFDDFIVTAYYFWYLWCHLLSNHYHYSNRSIYSKSNCFLIPVKHVAMKTIWI
ncbi:hypothetical protein DICVIV_03265 [Dictyocaulus viviparus]|uniref:Uncharacterized protein n=1 Tax=Dictyocaulus viviparus TaxID=29172 RepID=A0A0D8Y7L0_DICVI|nr:hypothetical protein DICVIV_03265 [Dictyocaulus viviparus]